MSGRSMQAAANTKQQQGNESPGPLLTGGTGGLGLLTARRLKMNAMPVSPLPSQPAPPPFCSATCSATPTRAATLTCSATLTVFVMP